MGPRLVGVLLLSIPLICYAMGAVFYYLGEGRIGMAITFASYTAANAGLIMDLYGI